MSRAKMLFVESIVEREIVVYDNQILLDDVPKQIDIAS
jgi:hypothetical protein